MPRMRAAMWAGAACLAMLLLLTGCDLFLGLFNQAPVVKITASILSGPSPLTVTLDGLRSEDDGEIVSYRWSLGDGSASTGSTVTHTYVATTRTLFTVTLTVTDDRGQTAEATQSIEVLPPGEGSGDGDAPIARMTIDPIIGVAPLTATLDAAGSTGGGASISSYTWDFGDGQSGTGSPVTHLYDPVDRTTEYTVTLTVWNDDGQMTSIQGRVIAIVPEVTTGGEDPTAEAIAEDPFLLFDSDRPAQIPTLYEVTFDGRASFADAGNTLEYYLWKFGDGDYTIETTDNKVTHIYELMTVAHTFVASLTVYDDEGA